MPWASGGRVQTSKATAVATPSPPLLPMVGYGMKVSVSLPSEDVKFLDVYAEEQGLESRSAALQRAVRLLRVAG